MGGKKNDKLGGLGRALIRQHNQSILEAKERGRALRQQQRVLESITDVADIDAVIEQAEEAERNYSVENSNPTAPIKLDETVITTEEERREAEALYASSLRVPRRPPWNETMTLEEFDDNERQAFLVWRRNLAKLEENEKLVLTPFEKNLDIWRQLWRVLERSDLLVMVVDARDPLFYRCPDLEAYAREIDERKSTMLLVNKADLLPCSVRQKWANYFSANKIPFLFWSAKAATASLEGKPLTSKWEDENPINKPDTKIYGREDLLAKLQAEAEAIAASTKSSSKKDSKHVVVGFVGYPNVGKSSTINALVGTKKTGVTSTPGKTKHFQTLIISDKLMFCDCPGLVFPSFSSSRYEMVASGVLPIDRMTQHREAVQVVANRVPRQVLEKVYKISISKPKPYESQTRAPFASELIRAYCSSRGYVSSSGLPDETKAARQILKDYIDGKIPHFELPPNVECTEIVKGEFVNGDGYYEEEEEDDDEMEKNALDDLEAFEISNGVLGKTGARKKKETGSSYKHHKKPQRKKDRTWRVGNDNGDGMPVVRVFQKPAVNFDAIRALN